MTIPQIGAGVQLPPNCTKALNSLGLLSDIEVVSEKPSHIAIRSYRDSGLLSAQNLVPYVEYQYNAPYLVAYRADLIRVLAQRATSLGVVIKLGSTVTKYDLTQPSVSTSNGETYKSDMVLGCDGERSLSREALQGVAASHCSSGDTVYRLTIESEILRQDTVLRWLVESPHVNAWFGPHAHAVSYPLPKQGLLNVALTEHRSGAELITPRDAIFDQLSDTMKGWDAAIVRLFRMAHSISKWTLLQPLEVRRWTHALGKFALLGDSAHAILPFL